MNCNWKQALCGLLVTVWTGGAAMAQGPEDLLELSRRNPSFATARSAGMSGAFVSLGADPASMSLNPAGLGMYGGASFCELMVSPGLDIVGGTANYAGAKQSLKTKGQTATRGYLGNASVVFPGESITFGIGVNRVADFNRTHRTRGYGEQFSIGDMFVEQLYGTPVSGIGSPDKDIYQAFKRYPSSMWGAIMGYQSALLNPVPGTGEEFGSAQLYTMNGMISPGAWITPEKIQRVRGGVTEYVMSGGGHIGDMLYVGASIGMPFFNYQRREAYMETASPGNVGLERLFYNQYLDITGLGFNLKVGATLRPLPWLRVGVAYHSPSWIRVSERYGADMSVYDTYRTPKGQWGYSDTPFPEYDYRIRTPSRLLAGVSATLGTLGILSVDYERTWYRGMKFGVTSDDDYSGVFDPYDQVNSQLRDLYRGVSTVRVGLEVQPVNKFFLRAGGSYSTSPYAERELRDYGAYWQVSGGVGFRSQRFSVDLAYVYGSMKQTPYKPYSYTAPSLSPDDPPYTVETEGTVFATNRNHNLLLSFGVRF